MTITKFSRRQKMVTWGLALAVGLIALWAVLTAVLYSPLEVKHKERLELPAEVHQPLPPCWLLYIENNNIGKSNEFKCVRLDTWNRNHEGEVYRP